MEILKNLGIEILPPENIKVSIKKVTESTQTYFFAHIYNDMGEVMEFLGSLFAFNEPDLKNQLKKMYAWEQKELSERTFDNFYDWYRKIANYIQHEKMLEIHKKFNK